MHFPHQLSNKNNKLKAVISGPTLVLLSTMTLPCFAQLPRFDSPVPKSPSVPNSAPVPKSPSFPNSAPVPKSASIETPSSPVAPSNTVQTKPSQPLMVKDSTAPLPEERQLSVGIIRPVNGFVNIKLKNQTAATISYEVIGDTTQRQLSGKSEVILRTLRVPVNITFHRETGGFLLIQPQFITDKGILELTMTETNDFNLDTSSLLIEETGSIFLN